MVEDTSQNPVVFSGNKGRKRGKARARARQAALMIASATVVSGSRERRVSRHSDSNSTSVASLGTRTKSARFRVNWSFPMHDDGVPAPKVLIRYRNVTLPWSKLPLRMSRRLQRPFGPAKTPATATLAKSTAGTCLVG